MKTKRLITVFVLSLTGGIRTAPLLYADITPVNFPTPPPQGNSVTGPILNIDPVNHQIQVKDYKGMVQTFRIDEFIQVYRNGLPMAFVDLGLGDVVTVTAK